MHAQRSTTFALLPRTNIVTAVPEFWRCSWDSPHTPLARAAHTRLWPGGSGPQLRCGPTAPPTVPSPPGPPTVQLSTWVGIEKKQWHVKTTPCLKHNTGARPSTHTRARKCAACRAALQCCPQLLVPHRPSPALTIYTTIAAHSPVSSTPLHTLPVFQARRRCCVGACRSLLTTAPAPSAY